MRIGVVGAGAIGSTFAWFLARAGHDLALLDVRADHVAAIARDGLVAELPDRGAVSAAVEATTDPSGLGPAEVVLVATKAFATGEAARGAGPLIGPETWVATVQNGLGNDRALARAVRRERVVAGSTTVAAELAGAGRVRIGESVLAGGSSTVFGPPRGAPGAPDGVARFAEALDGAGLPTRIDDEVELVIWRKLVLAGSMAPLSAVLGLTVGETMASPGAVGLLRKLVAEITAVGRASGVPLDEGEAWELCRSTFAGLGPHRPSMAVDLGEGRRTEIDAMCVEVARLGREHGVPATVNEVIGELVRSLEQAATTRR
jgi:2-dehydropantoate 2-reductase